MSLLIFMSACNEQDEEEIKDLGAIKARWKLAEVINISDEDKYLNSVLQMNWTIMLILTTMGILLVREIGV